MTGEDIFRALSEIDDELLVRPSRTALKMRKGRKRKKFALILVAVITLLMLCGFGYASRLDMTYEDGVVEISVYNPNVVDEYEQWSMSYIAEGYEITQVSDIMWEVSNGIQGFFLTQLDLVNTASRTFESEFISVADEIEILENITALSEEFLQTTRNFYWKTQNCTYHIIILEGAGEDAELVAMIRSITP